MWEKEIFKRYGRPERRRQGSWQETRRMTIKYNAGDDHLDAAAAGGMAVAFTTLPPRADAPAARLPTAPQTDAATPGRAPRFCE